MRFQIRLATLAAITFCSGAWAQSHVQLAGIVDLFAGQRQLAGAVKLNKVDSGGFSTSRIALEGSEDLGGGMKATFALSSFLRADTGDAGRVPGEAFWRRAAWVGLQSNLGTLRLGRVLSPTFTVAIRFSAFADSTAFAPYLLHFYTGAQPLAAPMNSPDSGADNGISYTTPTLGGFSGTVLVSLGETVGKGNRSVIGGTYSAGPFAAGLSAEHVKAPGALPTGVSAIDNIQAGASFDLGVAKLFAQAATSKLETPAAERKYKTWQLGASAPLGAGSLLLSWASTRKTEGVLAEVKRDTLGIGYDYLMSRRTDLYAVALQDKVTKLSTGNTLVAGIRHRF